MKNFLLTIFVITLISCYDRSAYEDLELEGGQQLVLPILKGKIGISKTYEAFENDNTSLKIDPEGKLTVVYNGQVVRNDANAIFPPVSGLPEFQLLDTNSFVPIPIRAQYTIKKAVFGEVLMQFRFLFPNSGPYTVKVTIPSITVGGSVWQKTYNITDGSSTNFTEAIQLDQNIVIPTDNKIQFIYDARNAAGDRLVLPYAAMKVDRIAFRYLEGFFAYQVFDIQGSNIGVGLFDTWERGGIDFDNPKMNIAVNNAFGFPIRSKVNLVRLTTLTGESFDLQSVYIDQGINFGYPTTNEAGQVKSTTFSFDKNNSNLKELFNNKVVNISYDIDAIANPDNDPNELNFIAETSFFTVDVGVEVPLLGKANDFTLQKQFDFDGSQLVDLSAASLVMEVTNSFPIDIRINAYALDDNGTVLDKLTLDPGINIPAGVLGTDLKVSAPTKSTPIAALTQAQLDKWALASKIKVLVSLNNPPQVNDLLWIYQDNIIDVDIKLKATRR